MRGYHRFPLRYQNKFEGLLLLSLSLPHNVLRWRYREGIVLILDPLLAQHKPVAKGGQSHLKPGINLCKSFRWTCFPVGLQSKVVILFLELGTGNPEKITKNTFLRWVRCSRLAP